MAGEGSEQGEVAPAEIGVLIFRAAGAVMAVDADQVDEIVDAATARQRGTEIGDVGAMLAGAGHSGHQASKVLLLSGEGGAFGFGVDELCEITNLETESLQPLPVLLSLFRGPRKFWGVAARRGEILLLLDLFSLKGTSREGRKQMSESEG